MEYVYIIQDGEICSGVFNLGEVEYVTRDFEDALNYLIDLIIDSEDDEYLGRQSRPGHVRSH